MRTELDFAALQRGVTVGVDPAAPAYLVAFDLLQHPICAAIGVDEQAAQQWSDAGARDTATMAANPPA